MYVYVCVCTHLCDVRMYIYVWPCVCSSHVRVLCVCMLVRERWIDKFVSFVCFFIFLFVYIHSSVCFNSCM